MSTWTPEFETLFRAYVPLRSAPQTLPPASVREIPHVSVMLLTALWSRTERKGWGEYITGVQCVGRGIVSPRCITRSLFKTESRASSFSSFSLTEDHRQGRIDA